MSDGGPAVFALASAADLGERVAEALGVPLMPREEGELANGEHKARPLASVRGRDAYVMQSLHGDERESVNDRLCHLLRCHLTLWEVMPGAAMTLATQRRLATACPSSASPR